MPSTPVRYHTLVLGSGQGGTPFAVASAAAGYRTLLIENSHLGGCCVNIGCTPTKTLIASGRVAYLARRAGEYGIHFPGAPDGQVAVDMVAVRQRKREIVESFRGGSERRAAGAPGLDVWYGTAKFVGEKTMLVEPIPGNDPVKGGEKVTSARLVEAETIVLNVGERPARPSIQGLDNVPKDRILDSTSIQELDTVPGHLAVLGGGYVGLEFAQLFRRLGSTVTIIQHGRQLLPREDPDIASRMRDILTEDGISIHLTTAVASVSYDKSSSSIALAIGPYDQSGGVSTNTVTGISHVLLAAGRTPNTDTLDTARAGLSVDGRKYIVVSPTLATNVPGIYAIGDCKGPPAFTHISYDDFRILRSNLLSPKQAVVQPLSTTGRIVPYVVYTDPQLGHVGMHELEARAMGKKIKVANMEMSHVARALETAETRGCMKAVVDAETERILGFTCLGMEGGEIMAVVQAAMMGGMTWRDLESAVWAHPSLAECLNNLWAGWE